MVAVLTNDYLNIWNLKEYLHCINENEANAPSITFFLQDITYKASMKTSSHQWQLDNSDAIHFLKRILFLYMEW